MPLTINSKHEENSTAHDDDLLGVNAALAQQAVEGVVKDGSGAPGAGANVIIKRTSVFAVTEASTPGRTGSRCAIRCNW